MDAALDWWDEFDVLVSPVTLERPWSLGLPDGAQHAGVFVWPSSFTGQPSMSLPLHQQDGLPIGVHLVGAPNADRTLLALAGVLERALPWAHRWPPLAEA
jgi:Asp-tRNA(Asn)/Glu-tRNA(Gln) amidotransferase A subunit family amidase